MNKITLHQPLLGLGKKYFDDEVQIKCWKLAKEYLDQKLHSAVQENSQIKKSSHSITEAPRHQATNAPTLGRP